MFVRRKPGADLNISIRILGEKSYLVTPLISGTTPGSRTLDRTLRAKSHSRLHIPVGYPTKRCSQVERDNQLSARSFVRFSQRRSHERGKTRVSSVERARKGNVWSY